MDTTTVVGSVGSVHTRVGRQPRLGCCLGAGLHHTAGVGLGPSLHEGGEVAVGFQLGPVGRVVRGVHL